MGWSVPEVPIRAPAVACSPWVCLFIMLLTVLAGLSWAIFSAPDGGLPSLLSGAWLPLTGYVMVGMMAAVTLYLLWWEAQALVCYYWNNWRLNIRAAWQRQAYQHLCVVSQTLLTPEAQCLPQMIGLATKENPENPPTTLLPKETLVPGISRFEQFCQYLVDQTTPSLSRWYPSGALTVVIQTSANDAEQEAHYFRMLWKQASLPWTPNIEVLADAAPFEYWNKCLLSTHTPVLVLAMHYRQPGENRAEFATALLLFPPSLLPAAEQKDSVRLFRAMPVKPGKLAAELQELRDMSQQPADALSLVWFSGLSAPLLQLLTTTLHDLSLTLCGSAPMAGLIDVDRETGRYGHLSGWLMTAMVSGAVSYGMESQWLLSADNNQGWAMAVGTRQPGGKRESENRPPVPFPAGSIMLALLLTTLLAGFLSDAYSAWFFSWSGMVTLLLILGTTLPGLTLIFRKIVANALLPTFMRAAGHHGRDTD